MSTSHAVTATSRSPLRLAVLLLAVLAAVLVGSLHTGQAVTHHQAATASASWADPDTPCPPHPDLPDHSARALGGAIPGTDLADDAAHASTGPDRFAVRAVAMPAERVPAVETSRLLASLCVWRR